MRARERDEDRVRDRVGHAVRVGKNDEIVMYSFFVIITRRIFKRR